MNRTQKILFEIDFKNPLVRGIEIGPLCRPIVEKKDGNIFYVDYADKAFLQKRYQHDPDVNIFEIVDTDGIWGANSLADAIREFSPVDYVIASHVIEHVPDVISWLQELDQVLMPGGRVSLVIPDKRYTFDFARSLTSIADLLGAYFGRYRIPMPREVIDHVLSHQHLHVVDAWNGAYPPKRIHTIDDLNGVAQLANDILKNNSYHDVHCWVFTPLSFCKLMLEFSRLELCNFLCRNFFNTQRNELEFFVQLQKSDNRKVIIESWEKIIDLLEPSQKKSLVARGFSYVRRLMQKTFRG
jgi:SAM-dependent methyltransferase